MIILMASVAVLALSTPDPQDPDEIIRTATAPGVSAETVAAEGETEAQADSRTLTTEQDPEPHGLTTGQQISRWLAEAPAVPPGAAEGYAGPVDGIVWDDERRVRGELSAGIGTGGYRQYGASVSVPLGESGQLELHYRDVKNGHPAYGDYGYGYDRDWMDPVIAPWRSDIGHAPIDVRDSRGRAWRDHGRTRAAPESER